MSRDEIMYLQDIAESCGRILRFTAGLSQPDLIGDDRTYDAVVRNLEIIGKAAKHVGEDLRRRMPKGGRDQGYVGARLLRHRQRYPLGCRAKQSAPIVESNRGFSG